MAELECLPLGIGQNNEGVCLQVKLGQYSLLLECGLKDLSPLLALNPNWTGVFCSHAHSDHMRGIVNLQAIAPHLPIYASTITARLLTLKFPELQCHTLDWGQEVEIQPNLVAKILPAGHLPGAASLWLKYIGQERTYGILYTGDFFLSNSRLVEGLRLEEFRGSHPDVLILEGSFGTAKHPHRRSQEQQLATQMISAIAAGQSIIFPVPQVGIGQEILMLLRSHHYFTGKDLDIWVDTHIAEACDLYTDLRSSLPPSVQNFAQNQSLFWDDRVRPRVQRLEPHQSIAPLRPCILFVDQNSHWRSRLDLSSGDWIMFWSEAEPQLDLPSDLNWQTYLLADHSDVAGTTQLIHTLKPQHVVLIHGSRSYLADLANLEELSNRYHIHCPAIGRSLELPVGTLQISENIPKFQPYTGELAELESDIVLTLPTAITVDRRWLSFADTGLIEARWQGEELVIRGISQRELLNLEKDMSEVAACGNCRYYRGYYCQNIDSPLHGLKVSIDGCCPAFLKN